MSVSTDRVVGTHCEICGEYMRQSRIMLWCPCGRLMSNNYGVFVEGP
jgi:hypothetical protein